MSQEGAQHVQEFLVQKGFKGKIRFLPKTTATAIDAALALGVPVSQIGKSVVLQSENQIVVAVVRGDYQVDIAALAVRLDVGSISPLRASDVKRHTGYVVGGVSPFGLPSTVKVIVDAELTTLGQCYVAAGHPNAVVLTSVSELINLTGASVSAIAIPRK